MDEISASLINAVLLIPCAMQAQVRASCLSLIHVASLHLDVICYMPFAYVLLHQEVAVPCVYITFGAPFFQIIYLLFYVPIL